MHNLQVKRKIHAPENCPTSSPPPLPKKKKKVHPKILYITFSNRPYMYSQFWPGTVLQLRLMQGVFSNANDIYLFLIIIPSA